MCAKRLWESTAKLDRAKMLHSLQLGFGIFAAVLFYLAFFTPTH